MKLIRATSRIRARRRRAEGSCAGRLDDDLSELLGVAQSAPSGHGVLEFLLLRRRGLADLARTRPDALAPRRPPGRLPSWRLRRPSFSGSKPDPHPEAARAAKTWDLADPRFGPRRSSVGAWRSCSCTGLSVPPVGRVQAHHHGGCWGGLLRGRYFKPGWASWGSSARPSRSRFCTRTWALVFVGPDPRTSPAGASSAAAGEHVDAM